MTTSSTISLQAQAFLETCAPTPQVPVAEIDFAKLRRDTRTSYQPQIDAALAQYPVTVSQTTLCNTPCQVVTPPNAVPHRKVLYFFGGGFIQGSPEEDLPITAALACSTGASFVVPYYPLAPEHPFPAALDCATDIARRILTETPGTPFVGESAGGNLALAITHRLQAENLRPGALALLSPAADILNTGDSGLVDRDPVLPHHRVATVAEAYLQGADGTHPDASPLNGPFTSTFPPTLITTGTRDLFLSNCVRLTRSLRNAGAKVDLRVWEGMWHVFEFYHGLPEAEASLAEIGEFLDKALARDDHSA